MSRALRKLSVREMYALRDKIGDASAALAAAIGAIDEAKRLAPPRSTFREKLVMEGIHVRADQDRLSKLLDEMEKLEPSEIPF